jgi:polyisoprenoid-binding protein YceI
MKTHFLLPFLFLGLILSSCKSSNAEETASETSSVSSTGTPKGVAYTVDAPRCELKWTGFKPTTSHFGIVPIGSGTIYVDGDLISGGTVEIKMSELEVHDLEGQKKIDLENHLKGTEAGEEDHFFNVQKYPTATFTVLNSVKLENDPLGTHQINGNLTVKGITNPISFKAVVDLSSGVGMKVVAEPFVIDRSKWDVRYKSKSFYADLNDKFIRDEIRFELTLGALKAQG